MSDVQATLAERGSRYGDFAGHAEIAQHLKFVMAVELPSMVALYDLPLSEMARS